MNNSYYIKDENPNRKYFCLLPNLLSRIGLTAFERSLYWAIKECAGENSSCTKSQPNLAEMSGLSKPSVQRTLKKLSETNKILGIPLIKIIHRNVADAREKDTNEIIIVDIWKENTDIIEKKIGNITQILPSITPISPSISQTLGVVSHRCEGSITQMYKEEPLNKNPSTKTTTPTSSKVVVAVSENKDKQAKQEAAKSLKDWVDREAHKKRKRKITQGHHEEVAWGQSWIFPTEIYQFLIDKYGFKYFQDQLNYMIQVQKDFDSGIGNKGIDKPESFLKKACKDNYAATIEE